jgi:hypothetical protein
MIDIPLIDELREVRRRLSEQSGCDAKRYAEMLQEEASQFRGRYVTKPLIPAGTITPPRTVESGEPAPSHT